MVNEGFTRKKVESLTLGEKLKKLRSDFRMSLSETSKATRIQVKYLEYLENGEYHKLPADVYVRGFLRSYARYLNVDEQALVKLYERERHIQENLNQEAPKKNFSVKNLNISSLVVTPRSVVLVLIACIVFGAFFYLYREFQAFAGPPRLIISSPENGAILETSEAVVTGKTDKGARVSINNQPVFVGSEGEFSDKLILQSGLNAITVIAVNRFDKENRATLSVEAQFTPSVPIESPPKAQGKETFQLDVTVHDAATKITLEADNALVFSGMMKPGERQTLSATERIQVTTENASRTFVRFNGLPEVALGGNQKTAQTVIFTPAGRQE